MSLPSASTLTLREIRARTDAETAARIKYSRDPMILMKLIEACNGNIDELTPELAKNVVFVSEFDINREEINQAYLERQGA